MITEQHIQDAYGLLQGFALKLTRNVMDSEDLLQDTMCRMWKSRDTYQGGNFNAWAYLICKNMFINSYRNKKVRPESTTRSDELESCILYGIDNTDAGILCSEIWEMIETLPEKEKDIYVDWIHGYKYIELAERYSLPMGTVKSRLFFARKNMANKLAVA